MGRKQMKVFPIIKVLTGVTVLFFTCLSLGADKEESFEACVDRMQSEQSVVDSCKQKSGSDSSDGKFSAADIDRCIESTAKKKCAGKRTKSEIKDDKNSCEQAFEKYSDLSTKEKEACAAFDKSGGSSCKAKADACNKKISSLSNPYQTVKGEDGETESKTNGYGALTEIAQVWATIETKNPNQSQTGSIASGGGACVKSIDRKARSQDKKDKDRERKELLDKITKQKDAILELQEELNKERAKNTKEINEINAENKKDVNGKDKELNEKLSSVTKQIADINIGLRSRSTAITKKMQKLAEVNFTYQSAMMELSDSNVKSDCENAFNNLKAAIVAKGDLPGLSAEEKAKVSAMVAQSKGIRGSGNLKRFLVTTRQKCYDSANMKRNATKLKNSQDVKNLQDEIDEEKNRMKDDKESISRAQKDLETARSQIDKEKQAAEAEKGDKLDALSKELANHVANIENKIAVASQKIQELTAEINKLVLVENFEVEDAYSEATEAIEKGKTSRARALETCDCKNQPTTHTICSQLGSDSKAYDGKKVQAPTKTPVEGKQ